MRKEKLGRSSFLVDIQPLCLTIACEEVYEFLQRRLTEHLLSSAYNNIGLFFQRQGAIKEPFKVDSFAHYQQFASGNCIGLTLGLIQNIVNYCRNWHEIMSLPPMFVIPATLPAHYGSAQDFGHVALLILCKDGLILLDSGFHIPQPIVLKNTEPVSLTVGEKTWRFQLDAKIEYKDDNPTLSGFITASLQTSRGLETFSYTLRHISNPDGIIFRTNMADAHRVSYVRRDWNGLQTSHVTLFLQEQLIKMALLKKDSHSYHRTAMSFSQRRSDNFDLKLRLYGCPPVLIKQIKQLISPSMEEENLLEPTPMPLIRV